MAQQTPETDDYAALIENHPDPETARDRFALLERYDVLSPYDDSRLLIQKTGAGVTVGQIQNDDLQLVTLKKQDLAEITCDGSGDLAGHPGTWEALDNTAMPLSGWDGGESQVILIEQTKFSADHYVVITNVDAAEILFHVNW